MKLFSYYKKTILFILITTIICILSHIFICSDIHNLKIHIHNLTRSYSILKFIFPMLYIMLGLNVLKYSTTIDSYKNIMLIFLLYLIIILFTILSSLLLFRYAKFIFSFWLTLFSLLIFAIARKIYFNDTLSLFTFMIFSYLVFVEFYFYFYTL